MHDKLYITDHAVAVYGGRKTADVDDRLL